jgi:integrase/recombinase XerD
MLTIYRRWKEGDDWKEGKIEEGRGIRTRNIAGPFFVRPFINGTQERRTLHSETFSAAKLEAAELESLIMAQARGLTVNELTTMQNSHRVPIKSAIETYLEQKKNKKPKTRAQYGTALREFSESLKHVRFLDEINTDVLRRHMNYLKEKGYAGKTIDTRVNIVTFMLKKNGVEARVPRDEMPTIETEAAVPYSDSELDAMFAEMEPEENIVYKFFLGSACRDQEVTFASWTDINFQRGTYTVRSKPDEGFTVKNHESRTIPLPDSLIAALKARRKKMPNDRWIFPNRDGGTRNHFLLKLKKIALRAGVNCGQCKTTVTKGEYANKKKVEVTCVTDPVCEHIYLHRLRKTCATRWDDAGVPARTIQHYLGHKSLETTQLYLGVASPDKVRDRINAAAGD